MLFSIIYISKAIKLMQNQDLLLLLEECRSWNKAHGLTGMLLYIQGQFAERKEGRFMQVLEGTELEVNKIFEKIKTDNRHHHIIPLNESTIKKRNFGNWSMGFESVELKDSETIQDFFELNADFLKTGNLQKFSSSLNFLKSFYIMNTPQKV